MTETRMKYFPLNGLKPCLGLTIAIGTLKYMGFSCNIDDRHIVNGTKADANIKCWLAIAEGSGMTTDVSSAHFIAISTRTDFHAELLASEFYVALARSLEWGVPDSLCLQLEEQPVAIAGR